MSQTATSDRERLATFYRAVSDPTSRAVIDVMIDNPDERMEARAIMRRAGLERHSDVARSMYAMGRVAREAGMERPWHESQLGYLMTTETAEALRSARG